MSENKEVFVTGMSVGDEVEKTTESSTTTANNSEPITVKMTDDQIDEIVKAATEATPKEVLKMNHSIEDTSEIENEEFAPEIRDISLDSSYEELLGANPDTLSESGISLFDIGDEDHLNLSDEDVENRVKDNLSGIMNLPEMEMIEFCSLITKYRKDKNMPNVYSQLPQTFKEMISQLCMEQKIPFTEYNHMAKMFLDEIVSQAEMDEVFIDIEKSLNEALKIPTIADMYSEHTNEVMNVKIPEIIEKIKDTEPENAKMLESVREQFQKAYSLELLREHYETNARTRKLMRRDWNDPIRFCDEFNLKNDHSKFKMPDCRSIGPALYRVFLKEEHEEDSRIAKMKIEDKDLNKFAILFCRSCINMNPSELLDAAYMYYALKNITMLNLTNESKTDFAAELINNICDIIEFVRAKEEEFDASSAAESNKRKRKRK